MLASTKWCVATRTYSKRSNPSCPDENLKDGKCRILFLKIRNANTNRFFFTAIIHCQSIRTYWRALKPECQCSQWPTPNTLKWIFAASYRARFVFNYFTDFDQITYNHSFRIPNQVIDEVLHVLNIISSSDMSNAAAGTKSIFCEKPLRTHEVLQELRDISSMAIDHFEEKIAPTLKKAYCELPSRSILSTSSIQFQCKSAVGKCQA